MKNEDIKIKFYNADISITQRTFSHNKIRDKKNYIYMAELDYIAFRMLYKTQGKLLHPIALAHAQQAVEKYSCFIQSFLFDKSLQRGHKISQFSFLSSVSSESKKVIETLFADFQKYRYLEEGYRYTIQQIADVLDEFVFNVWSLLLYSGIMGHMRFVDKFDTAFNTSFPSQIIPTLFIYKEDRTKDAMLETYLSTIEFENKFINNFNEIFDVYKARCMKPN